MDVYTLMAKRDQIKMISSGIINDDDVRLREENKQECIQSAASIEEQSLSDKDREVMNQILGHVTKAKIYGRAGEKHVYTGNNQKVYISDAVSIYLVKNEGFSIR